ncbi:MAG TPA: YceI family protein [Chitinophagaceae bacterium]
MSTTTIAIIGATGPIGRVLSSGLANRGHRLLLMDHDLFALEVLAKEIGSEGKQVDIMPCAGEASWEADVIIADIPVESIKELNRKMVPFSNRKPVILFIDVDPAATFPAARGVTVHVAASEPRLVFRSNYPDAVSIAKKLLEDAGLTAPVLQSLMNKQSKINTMETTKWTLDPTHSELHFKVRHLMVSWVTGAFQKFEATLETEGEDLSTAKVKFTADVNSISTNNDQRDAHLKTGDFFDSANHPEVHFESKGLVKVKDDQYKIQGDLTLRGITKNIILDVEFGGVAKDPWGNTRTGFSVTGKINRREFGVNFSMVSETGGVLLGEDVTINANVQFVKQAAVQSKAA